MPLGIDATLRYGLDIPPTEPLTQSQLQSDNPYNTRERRAAADADREPGARLDAGRRASGEGRTTSTSSASRTRSTTSSRRASSEFHAYSDAHGYGRVIAGATRLVGAARRPGRRVAVAAHAERRVRRARARLGVRRLLTSSADELEDAVRGLVALGFAGANVTTPHKAAAAALGGNGAPSVNTLVVRGRADLAATRPTRRSLAGLAAERPVILGGRWSRCRFPRGACRRRAVLPAGRRGRRKSTDADLVVNATSERDECSSSSVRGRRSSTSRTRRRPTATDGPRRRGARSRRRARGARRAGSGRPSSSGRGCRRLSRSCGGRRTA